MHMELKQRSNEDRDGNENENGNKAIGFDRLAKQSKQRIHVYVALTVDGRLRRESAKFHYLRRLWIQDSAFFFLFLNFDIVF